MNELLLELFSEEIPASMQIKAADYLANYCREKLTNSQVSYAKISSYVTPRRLVVHITELPEIIIGQEIRKKGPKIDANQLAIDGFLKSTSLKLEQLEQEVINGQSYYLAVIKEIDQTVSSFLQRMIEELLANFPWPKSMRWGYSTIRWVRPLRNILCLFSGHILPIKFGSLIANDLTYGHRFLAPKQPFAVNSFADYQQKLLDNKVILDIAERKKIIQKQISDILSNQEYQLINNEDLLEEVSGLVEWPVTLLGEFDKRFLSLPAEVLSTSMRNHQRYFSLNDKDGKLVSKFITVANIETQDSGKIIIDGNQKVLKARLTDAEFFWNHDLKTNLLDQNHKLTKITFHDKLGTVADKVKRMESIAQKLAIDLGYNDLDKLKQAVNLCKSDLTTDMVGEFPELQGVMGKYYASLQNYNKEVCQAIEQHYWPKGANDRLPQDKLSSIISIADKIDSIVGLFIAGEKPSGSKDPFALRRSAIAIINIMLNNNFNYSFSLLIEYTAKNYSGVKFSQEVLDEVQNFMLDRVKNIFKNQNISHDLIIAVVNGSDDNPFSLANKIRAISEAIHNDNTKQALVEYLRIAKIVVIEEKKAKTHFYDVYNIDLFKEIAEQKLFNSFEVLRPQIKQAISQQKYYKAIEFLQDLAPDISMFFEQIIINHQDDSIRQNRLALLTAIRNLYSEIANFTDLEL